MAEFALDQGWNRAIVVKDNLIVYFQDVVDAFAQRFTENGGEVVQTEEYLNSIAGAETGGTVQNVISAIQDTEADVIAISTAYDDLPALVGGLRSLGVETPIICSWACDGTYWNPEGLSNFYTVAYAALFGDDPNADVNALIQQMTDAGTPPAASSFVEERRASMRSPARSRRQAARTPRRSPSLRGLPGRADHLRQHLLLARAARGLRTGVPSDADPGWRAQLPRDLRRHLTGRDSLRWPAGGGRRPNRAVARRDPAGPPLFPAPTRACRRSRGCPSTPPPRGRRADRPERRGQDDPRQHRHGLRPAGADRRAGARGDHDVAPGSPRARPGTHVPAHPRVLVAFRA